LLKISACISGRIRQAKSKKPKLLRLGFQYLLLVRSGYLSPTSTETHDGSIFQFPRANPPIAVAKGVWFFCACMDLMSVVNLLSYRMARIILIRTASVKCFVNNLLQAACVSFYWGAARSLSYAALIYIWPRERPTGRQYFLALNAALLTFHSSEQMSAGLVRHVSHLKADGQLNFIEAAQFPKQNLVFILRPPSRTPLSSRFRVSIGTSMLLIKAAQFL